MLLLLLVLRQVLLLLMVLVLVLVLLLLVVLMLVLLLLVLVLELLELLGTSTVRPNRPTSRADRHLQLDFLGNRLVAGLLLWAVPVELAERGGGGVARTQLTCHEAALGTLHGAALAAALGHGACVERDGCATSDRHTSPFVVIERDTVHRAESIEEQCPHAGVVGDCALGHTHVGAARRETGRRATADGRMHYVQMYSFTRREDG